MASRVAWAEAEFEESVDGYSELVRHFAMLMSRTRDAVAQSNDLVASTLEARNRSMQIARDQARKTRAHTDCR